MAPRLAALLIPLLFTVACATIASPLSPREHDRLADDRYGGGGNLRASWNQVLVAEYAEIDLKVMEPLSAALNEPISYSEFSAIVRASCDMLDDLVDPGNPEPGLTKVHAQQHKPEGRVAVWVFVRTGGSWEGYCGFHRAGPEATPAPTPTPWPPLTHAPTPTPLPLGPLTVCMGWAGEGIDDSFDCGLGGTGVGRHIRVKVLPEGQAGRLEVTYPRRPPDGSEPILCGYPGRNGFHLRASEDPVYEQFETCAEGRVQFRWMPDGGEEYLYEFWVGQ